MLLALTATLLIGSAPAPSARCSVIELRGAPDYQYRVERIREFIDSASVIVHAVALAPDELRLADTKDPRPAVTFAIQEQLHGRPIPDTLRLPGTLVETDDFNPGSVPYRMVRLAGQRGDCYAQEYRVGAQYLLILRESPRGDLTPYWKPLAPLNEQIHGPEDPWIRWVRQQLIRSDP